MVYLEPGRRSNHSPDPSLPRTSVIKTSRPELKYTAREYTLFSKGRGRTQRGAGYNSCAHMSPGLGGWLVQKDEIVG